MEKEPYNQRDHEHCWNQKVPACGIPIFDHKVCCLCEKPMKNKETNEIKGLPRLANPTPEVIEEIMAPVKELREIMKETNEKKWIQKVCPKCITLTLVQEPRIVSYCEKCGTELDLSKPVVEKKCSHQYPPALCGSECDGVPFEHHYHCANCNEPIERFIKTTPTVVSNWREEILKHSHEEYIGSSGDLFINTTRAMKIIEEAEKEAYERGQGKMVIDWGVKELENARLEGKKEAEVALMAELEGMKNKGNNGEGLPFENSPEIYGNARVESYKKGFNESLDLIISNLRERIQ